MRALISTKSLSSVFASAFPATQTPEARAILETQKKVGKGQGGRGGKRGGGKGILEGLGGIGNGALDDFRS